MRIQRTSQCGSMLIIIILSVAVLVPTIMLLTSWLSQHQRLLTHSQIKVDKAESAFSAAKETERMVRGLPNPVGLSKTWILGLSETYFVHVDSDTVVNVTVTHEGYQ